MFNRKRLLSGMVSAAVVLVSLTACGSSSSTPTTPTPSNTAPQSSLQEESTGVIKEEFVSIGTSSSGGTFNTLGVAFGQIWSDKIDPTQFSAEVTGGSSENCARIGNNEIQFAFASAASAYDAFNGIGDFSGKKVEDMRAVANLYPAIMQMPVLKSSNIKVLDDIVGKRINLGQAGSGSVTQAMSILDCYDIKVDSFQSQQLSHANASDALIDEKLDGYIISGSLGQSHQMKSLSSGKAIMASFGPPEKIAKLIETYPYYYAYSIPKGSYPNQETDVETIATGTLLIVNKNMSEELVYQVTKTMFENVQELAKTQAIAAEIKLESALKLSDVPLHPGAERYYKEIGLITK